MLQLRGMFAQRQITSEVEVSLLVVSISIDIWYPALAVSRVNTWRINYEGANKIRMYFLWKWRAKRALRSETNVFRRSSQKPHHLQSS